MMQKKWFKVFIWFIATTFFFLMSAILISALGPGASENQIMLFMSGMMQSMNSFMGLSMTLEGNDCLKLLVGKFAAVTIPLVILAILGGLLVKLGRRKNAG